MADTVTPPTVTVAAGKKQTFSVPVTWLVEPRGVGAMEAKGLYQAPAAINADQDLSVIAHDADGREIGRSTIRLLAGALAPAAQTPSHGVLPASVALTAGQSQQFAVQITWALEPASAPGSIDAQSGRYEAPCDSSMPKFFCVVATSADGRKVGRARVTVVAADAPVGSLKIMPEAVEIGEGDQTAFRVDPSDPGVVWDSPARGAISPSGVYTSPPKIVVSQSIVITARSVDGAQFGHATVKLTDSRHRLKVLGRFWVAAVAILGVAVLFVWTKTVATSEEVAVVASPPAVTLNVTSEKMQTFTAEVLGVTDDGKKGVTWSRSANAPGNVDQGTGVYTTDDNEAEGQAFVTATSKTDPSLSSTVVVYRTKDTSFKVVPPSVRPNASKSATFSVQRGSTTPPTTPPSSSSTKPGGTAPQTTTTAPPATTTTTVPPANTASGTASSPPVQDGAIEWSISPNLGVVKPEQDGRATYEAPASIDRTEVVTITAKSGRGIASASIILAGPPKASASLHLVLLAILMGSLGSALHAVLSLTVYVGSQKFVATWAWWYFSRPFVGGALALFFYFLLALGKVEQATLDPSWVALMGGMAGLFADKATTKLAEIFDALIGPKTDSRPHKLEGGAASPTSKGAVPTIAKIDPPSAKSGETPKLTVTGANFRDGAAIEVKGVQRAATKVTTTSIEVSLTKEDTASTGDVEIVVVNKDGTKSAATKFPIVAP